MPSRGVLGPVSFLSRGVPPGMPATPVPNTLYRENVVKAWGKADTVGGVTDSFNVTSVTDTGAGALTWTWNTDLGSSTYAIIPGNESAAATSDKIDNATGPTAGACLHHVLTTTTGALTDPNFYFILVVGDQ